jgi:hypothetical protein
MSWFLFAQERAWPNMPQGMARLFISQNRLDSWSAEERIKVDGEVMTLAGDGRSFKLKPAVRFMKVAGSDNDPDPNQLVGKVKTVESLHKIGGEQYLESVIVGETAYDVQSGFIGEPVG